MDGGGKDAWRRGGREEEMSKKEMMGGAYKAIKKGIIYVILP